jgi:hypothetical protein
MNSLLLVINKNLERHIPFEDSVEHLAYAKFWLGTRRTWSSMVSAPQPAARRGAESIEAQRQIDRGVALNRPCSGAVFAVPPVAAAARFAVAARSGQAWGGAGVADLQRKWQISTAAAPEEK